MYIKQGYAVIAYLLGLFYLNHIMLYLSPLEDPDDHDTLLRTEREKDEYKGFQRKITEFEFWKSIFAATFAAAIGSFFESTDIEIYWPLLMCYFIMMTLFLCRVKIEHMVRYNYIPFEIGKEKYSKE